MDPRQKCEVLLEEHAEDRIVDRGLGFGDLVMMVRKGTWQGRGGEEYNITYRSWTVMVKLGQCTISVDTAYP